MKRGSTRFLVVPAAFAALALLPSAGLAQQAPPIVQPPSEQASCGASLPLLTSDQMLLTQPADAGENDKGVINYTAVRGSIVHMEGPLVLLRLDTAGMGNATSNHELAGDSWAVVRLPGDCPMSDLSMGSGILAIGTPTDEGILDAVSVTQTG